MREGKVSKSKRYVVRVRREYQRAVPDSRLDASADGVFDSRERADDWCQALNWCAGYNRFTVQEVGADKARKEAA